MTLAMLCDLSNQKLDEQLTLWGKDDSSIDGTDAWLRTRDQIQVIKGNGPL